MYAIPLSDQCLSVILGSLLGDGSLAMNKGYVNARFSFRHSVKQKNYFLWKTELLKEISSTRCIWYQDLISDPNSWGGDKYRYQSRACTQLTDLYKLTTKKGKRVVRRKWLNLMTPLSLAIWWLDDGSLTSHCRKGVLCTDGFSLEENKILQQYLSVVWGIKTSLGKTSTSHRGNSPRYYRLYFRSTEQLQKFLSIILPFIKVEDMLYKVLVLYKDSELQERWISKILDSTNFSRDVVIQQIEKRKAKLLDYRE